MHFKDRLKEARLNKNMTQNDIAKALKVTSAAVSNYEKGYREPTVKYLNEFMELLGIDANYLFQDDITWKYEFRATLSEQELIKKYRSLDNYGKKVINNLVDIEFERCTKIEEEPTPYITRTHFSIGASAGNGETLIDDMYKSEITIPATKLNESADFVIDVKGSSMEPTYLNGQKVLVRKQDSIEIGEVGIFIINSESFIKELGINELISHNKNYQNINLTEFDNVQCVGKVVGILQ